MTYRFIMRLPNAEILEGETDAFESINFSDVRIKFNGRVYITSVSNVVIFYDEQEYKEALEQHDTRTTLGF